MRTTLLVPALLLCAGSPPGGWLDASSSRHAQSARASSVDPRLFDAQLSPGALIGLEGAWIPGHLQRYAGFSLGFSDDELVSKERGEPVHAPLHQRWAGTFGFGLGLFELLEVQLGVPIHYNDGPPVPGDAASSPGREAKSLGVGDVRLALRWALLRAELGLTLQLAAYLPTGGKVPFSGDDALVVEPRVMLDWRGAGGLALTLHVGYRVRPERRVGDLVIDDEVRLGAGVELCAGALGARVPLALLAEIEGSLGLGEAALGGHKLPFEARVGVRAFGRNWSVTLASGAGLSDGYGAPDYRFLASVTFAPGDLDGPRPLPRAERRVIEAPSFPAAPDLASAEALDAAVRDDPDPDGDGVAADRCPHEREDRDGFEDDDGCPEPDNDGDGVPDAADRCPEEREVPNGVADDDGCADEGTAMVVARDGTIELTQTIEFRSGSDVLLPSAAPLIAQIAAVLRANPQVKRARIEGHTDGEGDREMNVDLSERRAARVRQKLIELGIDGLRLLPRGYGATRPIAREDSNEGRKRNRRVEFRIIDPPPPGAPRIEEVP